MANVNYFPSGNSESEENPNDEHLESPHRLKLDDTSSQHIRIVLFREGRLKECQLLFDSSLYLRKEKERTSGHGHGAHSSKKRCEENLYLTDMIFGSTAMRYNGTYFKIHDVSSPHRIIFTQVFSTPHRRSIKSSWNADPSRSSYDLLKWEKLDNTNAVSEGYSFNGSILESLFSLNNTNSTATVDSGFGDQSFASDFPSSSISLNQENCSLRMVNTSTSLQDSFLDNSDTNIVRYTRFGLALIIAYTADKKLYRDFFMENISFIQSMMFRLRKYVETAFKKPDFFVAVMLEKSNDSTHWLQNFAKSLKITGSDDDVNCHLPQKSTFGLSSITKHLKQKWKSWKRGIIFSRKDEESGLFLDLLKNLEVKDRNFFMSTILTGILTYHLGWIETCWKPSIGPSFVTRNSYNALWRQLIELCESFGSVNSRTIIGGSDIGVIEKLLTFARYFMRYHKVEKRTVEREDVLGENENVNIICDRCLQGRMEQGYWNQPKQFRKNKTFNLNLINMDEFDEEKLESNKTVYSDNNVMFILGDDEKLVDLKKTDLSTKIYRSNFSEKSGTLSRNKKTFSSLCSIMDEESSKYNLSEELSNENRKFDDKNIEDSATPIKMKVLKFPLPRMKTSEFSTDLSFPLSMRKTSLGEIVPDVILQGSLMTTQLCENKLKKDLLQNYSFSSGEYTGESIAVLGDIDEWSVKMMSNKRSSIKRGSCIDNVDASVLVSNMLEVLLQMGKMGIPKQYCMTHVEQRLLEICLRANALAKLLLNTSFCTMDRLVSTLDINAVDVPLLMAVASHLEPEISQKYGLSYQ